MAVTAGRDGKNVVKTAPWSCPIDKFIYISEILRPFVSNIKLQTVIIFEYILPESRNGRGRVSAAVNNGVNQKEDNEHKT